MPSSRFGCRKGRRSAMSGATTMKMVILTILLGLLVPIARVSSAADDKVDARSEAKKWLIDEAKDWKAIGT
jgi:hypothetical protein